MEIEDIGWSPYDEYFACSADNNSHIIVWRMSKCFIEDETE